MICIRIGNVEFIYETNDVCELCHVRRIVVVPASCAFSFRNNHRVLLTLFIIQSSLFVYGLYAV